MNKSENNTNITYYQKARFFRKKDTNEYAYCVEPFSFFYEKETYEETTHPYNLSQEQIDRISKIAYYGYGYKNHTDLKWYAITQMMIWKTSNENGKYYFTDKLNGKEITIYQEEMNEIEELIQQSTIKPSLDNQEFYMVEDNTLIIEDINQVLRDYHTNEENITIENNKLRIENLEEGDYEFTLTKEEGQRTTPLLFYQSNNSQNIIKVGKIENQDIVIKVHVQKTVLELDKVDKDTQTTIPSGEASLDGAKYELLDENKNFLKELVIKENQAFQFNLNYGKYYIHEIEAGKGYTLNPNYYEVEITKDQTSISVILENEVIKKEITIEKYYGEDNNWKTEENISFSLTNEKEELIDTLTTNKEGKIIITLPYGTYQLDQINTTSGYEKSNRKTIIVNEGESETITLYDLKIPVPNTHTERKRIPIRIIIQILWILLR